MEVNTEDVTTQQTTPESAQSATVVQQPTAEDQAEVIKRLQEEVAALNKQIAAQRDAIAQEHLNAASKTAAARPEPLNTKQQDITRTRAQATCGGLARWFQLPLADRMKAQGHPAPTPDDIRDAQEYFGPASSGAVAQSLAKSSPSRYAFLRLVFLESGRK